MPVSGQLRNELSSRLEQQFDKLLSGPLAPGLYLVSTPIGNLADISLRALCTLILADFVFCEDTRHSRKLLSAYGIGRKLESYHDFSGERDRTRILARLRDGKSVALISDAGTPLVADPGFKLVRDAIAEGFPVLPVPGASAILAALTASGLPTDRFFFGGYLPAKDGARRKALEAVRAIPGTLIFLETAGRLQATLQVLATLCPGRPVVLAKELTKLYETILRGSASSLLRKLSENPAVGEFVLVIGPEHDEAPAEETIEAQLREELKTHSLREAVEEVAKRLGAGRKTVYNLALRIKGET